MKIIVDKVKCIHFLNIFAYTQFAFYCNSRQRNLVCSALLVVIFSLFCQCAIREYFVAYRKQNILVG